MRFLVYEHTDLLHEISKSSLAKESFSFVKKSGLLHVKYSGHPRDFTFYRNSETVLNESKSWDNKVFYYFDKPSKNGVSTDWDGILFAFGIWLRSLG